MATVPPFPSTGNPLIQEHTVADLFAAYERDVLPDLAPKSQYYYRWFLKRFGPDLGALPLSMLSPTVLKGWQQELRQRLSVGTLRTYMAVLSAILETAVRDYAWLEVNPLRKLRKPREPHGRVRFLSDDERTRLLHACQQSRNPALYILVVISISVGLRKDELRWLRWREVDLARGVLRLEQTKNRDRRSVPITGLALTLLAQWRPTDASDSDLVFPGRSGSAPVLIEKGWRSARKRAELIDFRWHDMRHSCASYLAMNGASLLDIATILGHRKIASTMRYAHLTSAHLRGVADKMTAHVFGAPSPDGATILEEPRP